PCFVVDVLYYAFEFLKRALCYHYCIPDLRGPVVVHRALDQLFHLQEVKLDGGFAAEEGYAHPDLAFLLVYRFHNAFEISEGTIYDLYCLAWLECHLELGGGGRLHLLENAVSFILRQGRGLIADAYEARYTGGVAHHVPGALVHDHL